MASVVADHSNSIKTDLQRRPSGTRVGWTILEGLRDANVFHTTKHIMKDYEKIIAEEELVIEFWWEPGDNEFRAVARVDGGDDGWVGTGDSVTVATIMSVGAYIQDRDKAKAS